jgi:hypothetical protein
MLDSLFKSRVNAEDILAIAHYFQGTAARTAEAQNVKNKFFSWYQTYSNSVWESWATDESFQTAAKFRDEFNRLNAVTPQQVLAVRNVQQYGLTRDEALGLPPNTIDLWSRTKKYGRYLAIGAGVVGIGYLALQTKSALALVKRFIPGT